MGHNSLILHLWSSTCRQLLVGESSPQLLSLYNLWEGSCESCKFQEPPAASEFCLFLSLVSFLSVSNIPELPPRRDVLIWRKTVVQHFHPVLAIHRLETFQNYEEGPMLILCCIWGRGWGNEGVCVETTSGH